MQQKGLYKAKISYEDGNKKSNHHHCENLPAEWNIKSGEDFVSFQPLLVFDVKLKAESVISL
jgi:hypothetical protein